MRQMCVFEVTSSATLNQLRPNKTLNDCTTKAYGSSVLFVSNDQFSVKWLEDKTQVTLNSGATDYDGKYAYGALVSSRNYAAYKYKFDVTVNANTQSTDIWLLNSCTQPSCDTIPLTQGVNARVIIRLPDASLHDLVAPIIGYSLLAVLTAVTILIARVNLRGFRS